MTTSISEPLQVTRTIYRVSDFLSWARQGRLDLRPEFQRGSVWKKRAKSYLIDSMLKGFPVPILFLQDQSDLKTFESIRRVVDGQQRLRTAIGFVDRKAIKEFDPDEDDFTISRTHNSDYAGMRFAEMPDAAKQRILDFEFSVHVLPASTPNAQLLQVFTRMNATGVRVNKQELRNAEFSGEFKQICYDLGLEWTDEWLEWKVFAKPQLARMDEIEITSELLMFMDMGLTGKSQVAMNSYYRKHEESLAPGEEMRRRFTAVMERLSELFGGDDEYLLVFRTRSWLYSLFCALYRAMYNKGLGIKRAKPAVVSMVKARKILAQKAEQLQSKLIDAELAKALRGASDDRRSREARNDFLQKVF